MTTSRATINEIDRAVGRARRSDPLSSHEAAARTEASGAAATQRERVLDVLRLHPGKTSNELANWVFYECGIVRGLDRYQVARRLPELEAGGLVEKGDLRVCAVSGKRAVTWWPVQTQRRML